MPRACVIVLDAVGAGDLPDADVFGTSGSNTLAHVAEAVGGLDLPNLQSLGLGNILPLEGCPPRPGAPSVWGRLAERSAGMDTTTGHWEMMGIVLERPFPTFPDGFPNDVIDAFSAATGRGVLGNVAASGTEIIQELGDEHRRTGSWIVYTSADSVFQIAAHEDVVPVDELYAACRTARGQLQGANAVGRVIARPFEGESGDYRRTPDATTSRSTRPARTTSTGSATRASAPTASARSATSSPAGGWTARRPRESNVQGVARTIERLRDLPDRSFVFVNLVETDMVWGHRNDPQGFADCLAEFDEELPRLLSALWHGDLLILTSDHGCDPTTPSTDHSREHGLLLAHIVGLPSMGRRHDGDSFADVGATVLQHVAGLRDSELPGVPVV